MIYLSIVNNQEANQMGLFKSYSEKEVKRVQPIVNKINSLEPEMEKLSDEELRAKTDYFKKQLADGKW